MQGKSSAREEEWKRYAQQFVHMHDVCTKRYSDIEEHGKQNVGPKAHSTVC